MKKWFLLISVFAFVFLSCDLSGGNNDDKDEAVGTTEEESADDGTNTTTEADDPEVIDQQDTSWQDDRTKDIDSAGYKWIRKPVKKDLILRSVVYNIADGDPIAAYCTEPGWAYIFYNDQAVIGYEPFPDRIDILQAAVAITVEVHNRDNPSEQWGFINVPMPAPPAPITSNDPVLGKWQFALCIDTGAIVDGPYTAEFDWEWQMWKEGIARQMWEMYNRDHDPDAHIVWGTE